MIEFTKGDLHKVINVMAALKKGRYDVDGEEILAFAQSFAWISQLADKIKADIEKPLTPPTEMTYETKPEKKAKK